MTTDCWRAYPAAAEAAGVTHLTVNHAKTFRDPDTGAHTNNVEGIHGVIKRAALAQFSRLPYLMRDGMTYYLDLLIWRENQHLQDKPAFTAFLKDLYFWTHSPLEDFNRRIPVFPEELKDEELKDEEEDDEEILGNADDGEWFIQAEDVEKELDSDDDYF